MPGTRKIDSTEERAGAHRGEKRAEEVTTDCTRFLKHVLEMTRSPSARPLPARSRIEGRANDLYTCSRAGVKRADDAMGPRARVTLGRTQILEGLAPTRRWERWGSTKGESAQSGKNREARKFRARVTPEGGPRSPNTIVPTSETVSGTQPTGGEHAPGSPLTGTGEIRGPNAARGAAYTGKAAHEDPLRHRARLVHEGLAEITLDPPWPRRSRTAPTGGLSRPVGRRRDFSFSSCALRAESGIAPPHQATRDPAGCRGWGRSMTTER
jgi:hypothetical protein